MDSHTKRRFRVGDLVYMPDQCSYMTGVVAGYCIPDRVVSSDYVYVVWHEGEPPSRVIEYRLAPISERISNE